MKNRRKPEAWLGIPDREVRYAPDKELLMRCWNEYFCAGAVFERKEGVWRVKKLAPIIGWMKGREMRAIKKELMRRGCNWEWVKKDN